MNPLDTLRSSLDLAVAQRRVSKTRPSRGALLTAIVVYREQVRHPASAVVVESGAAEVLASFDALEPTAREEAWDLASRGAL